MVRGFKFEIDAEVIRKAIKSNGGQDRFKPKVERDRKRYTRKVKHKRSFDEI